MYFLSKFSTDRRAVIVLFLSVAPLGLWAGQASAQNQGVDTIIVTAQKRPENIQEVPMSVSAFSGAQLERDNITSVADLSKLVPSLSINISNNNRNSSVIIRNVGTAGTNPGTDQDVGVFIDGVYYPVAGPVYSELNDISTVEVLRGPQGTLYGRNTPVGAINITTRAPTSRPEAYGELQVGNFGELKADGYAGGGIAPNLSGRLSAYFDKEDGYLKNIYDGSQVWAQRQYGLRGRARWTPDSLTTVDVIAYYSYARSTGNNATQVNPLGPGGIVFGYNPTPTSFATSPFVVAQTATNPSHPYVVPGKWQVDSADASLDRTQLYGASLQASRDVPQIGATITDILAYNGYVDSVPQQSPGELPLDLATNGQHDNIKTTSNELKVVSDGKHFIEYVGGIYLFYSDLDYTSTITVGSQENRVFPAATGGGGKIPAGNSQALVYGQTTDAAAVYFQGTVNLTNAWRVLIGGRYSNDKKDANIVSTLSNVLGGPLSPVYVSNIGGNGQITASRRDQSTTWMYGTQYDLAKSLMVYATAASGFKDGGFNSRSAIITPFSFSPETSYTYEAGLKSTWFGRKLLINADVFRMLLHDYQQSTIIAGGTGFAIGNAGNFRDQGLELDVQATPIEPLTLKFSESYIPSKITGGASMLTCDTTYPFAGSAPPASSGPYTDATHKFCNFNGLKQSYAPLIHWSASARWEQGVPGTPFRWFASGTASYSGAQYLDASLDPRSYQGGYTLFDANLGVESKEGGWRAQLYGKNLSDRRYYVTESAQTQGAYISGGGTAAANGFIGWLGTPRTFGVQVSYRF